ncbi:MAG: ABC transporter ATP-binding protein [Candidatus Melainabacteria bacterium]|nr:ABC transporter ATP-binding protein [Candidatus Melainabacteria bacterium]
MQIDAPNTVSATMQSPSSKNKLEAIGLKAGYDLNAVVVNINLSVQRSKVTVLAGPNGCGKSTVIKVLARQLKPIEGSVQLDGADVHSMPGETFAKKVAYVPQSIDFSNELTVEEVVRLGRNPHQKWWSWTESEADAEATHAAIAKAGLNGLEKRPFTNLSGGEQKRALIATALAQEPAFILMDEPIAHLDFKHQLSLLSLIAELKEKSIGILLVLHDLNMIDRIADEIALLLPQSDKPSEVYAIGQKDEILSPENIATVFDVSVSIFPDSSSQGRHFSIEEKTKANRT